MEDYKLDIMIDSGPSARSIQIELKPFTLIGATTRAGLLSAPLRSRFGISNRLDYYPASALKKIVERSARLIHIDIDDEGALEIARRSRGTPRIANRLLNRTRDFAQVKVDGHGFDEMDKRILLTIIEKFGGGPVGLNTI